MIPLKIGINKIIFFSIIICNSCYSQKLDKVYIKFDYKENKECLIDNRKNETLQEDFIKTILHSKVETSTTIVFNKCDIMTFYYKKIDDVLPSVVDYKSLNLIDFNSKNEFTEQLKPYKKRDFYIVEIQGKENAFLYKVNYKVDTSH